MTDPTPPSVDLSKDAMNKLCDHAIMHALAIEAYATKAQAIVWAPLIRKLVDHIRDLSAENEALKTRATAADATITAAMEGAVMVKRDTRHDRDLTVAKAALEAAAQLVNKSVIHGGMAKSMAFFVHASEWEGYKEASLLYSKKILSIDPAKIVKNMDGGE